MYWRDPLLWMVIVPFCSVRALLQPALGFVPPLGVGVGVGVGVTPPPATTMPLTLGFSVPVVNWMTTWPLLLAVVLKLREMARFWPPAALKMSKLDRTLVPLIETLKSRWPAAER